MDEKPILTLGKKLNINWQGYVLRTEEGDFELPNCIRVMPWQQHSLRTIIPSLIMIQVTAITASEDALSWQIFY
jgi:hypothetical protein